MEYKVTDRHGRQLFSSVLLMLLLQGLAIGEAQEKEVLPKIVPTKSVAPSVTAPTVSDANGTTLFDLPFKVDKEDILVETLRYMDSIMNRKVNPCEDFYEYACGNWKNSERVPKESHSTTFLTAILNKMEKFLIEQMKNVSKEDENMQISKRFFGACVKDFNNLKVGIDSLLLEEQSIYDKVKHENGTKWIQLNFMSPYNIFPLLPLSLIHI